MSLSWKSFIELAWFIAKEKENIYTTVNRWAYIRHYNLNLLVRVKTSKAARYLLRGSKWLDKRPLSFQLVAFLTPFIWWIKSHILVPLREEWRKYHVLANGYAIVFFQEWNFSNSFNCFLFKLSVQCINKSTIFSRAILFCIIRIPLMWTNILYWVLPLILSIYIVAPKSKTSWNVFLFLLHCYLFVCVDETYTCYLNIFHAVCRSSSRNPSRSPGINYFSLALHM